MDKIMSFLVHVADISHPAKPWELHHQWSEALLEEFFEQVLYLKVYAYIIGLCNSSDSKAKG